MGYHTPARGYFLLKTLQLYYLSSKRLCWVVKFRFGGDHILTFSGTLIADCYKEIYTSDQPPRLFTPFLCNDIWLAPGLHITKNDHIWCCGWSAPVRKYLKKGGFHRTPRPMRYGPPNWHLSNSGALNYVYNTYDVPYISTSRQVWKVSAGGPMPLDHFQSTLIRGLSDPPLRLYSWKPNYKYKHINSEKHMLTYNNMAHG
jgi:hypothetical protein